MEVTFCAASALYTELSASALPKADDISATLIPTIASVEVAITFSTSSLSPKFAAAISPDTL